MGAKLLVPSLRHLANAKGQQNRQGHCDGPTHMSASFSHLLLRGGEWGERKALCHLSHPATNQGFKDLQEKEVSLQEG